MTKVWIIANNVEFHSGTSFHIVGNAANDTRGPEAEIQVRFEDVGTLSCFGMFIACNFSAGSDVYTIRNGGCDGNEIITVTCTNTGLFEDTTNCDSISAGDLIDVDSIIASSFNAMVYSRNVFDTTSGIHSMHSGADVNESTACATDFIGFHSKIINTTEVNTEVEHACGATLSGLSAYANCNKRTNNTSIRPRINSSTGNQIITWCGTETGIKTDTCNTDSITGGDNSTNVILTGTGTCFIVFSVLSINSTDTTGINLLANTSEEILNVGETGDAAIVGSLISMTPGVCQNRFQLPALLEKDWSDLWVFSPSNSLSSATTTATSRIGGCDGNQTVNYTFGVTGEKKDTTNSDSISVCDDMNWRFVVASGGCGSFGISSATSLLTEPSDGRVHWSTPINSGGMI